MIIKSINILTIFEEPFSHAYKLFTINYNSLKNKKRQLLHHIRPVIPFLSLMLMSAFLSIINLTALSKSFFIALKFQRKRIRTFVKNQIILLT